VLGASKASATAPAGGWCPSKSVGRRPAMDRAAFGEHIARRGPPSECRGTFRRRNPTRVTAAVRGLSAAPAVVRRELIDTLGRGWPTVRRRATKRVRGDRGDNPGQGFRWLALKGRNPGEHPAGAGLIACRRARDSWKGKSPEAAASRAGPPLRRLEKREEKRHVGAFGRKRAGDLPRGESSEG